MPRRPPAHQPRRLRTRADVTQSSKFKDISTPDDRPNAAQRGYCSKKHRAWRKAVLLRDAWTCVKCKRVCTDEKEAQADHVSPIVRGTDRCRDGSGRYDVSNGQTLCMTCHAKKTAEESGRRSKYCSFHPQWLPKSNIPVTLVCGPPASGKTTYVKENMSEGDIVIDTDAIASEGLEDTVHDWSRDNLSEVIRKRNAMIAELHREEVAGRAWLICCEPDPGHRQWWVDKIGVGRVVVIETAAGVCEQRIQAGGSDRSGQRGAAVRWWREYVTRFGEERVVVGD